MVEKSFVNLVTVEGFEEENSFRHIPRYNVMRNDGCPNDRYRRTSDSSWLNESSHQKRPSMQMSKRNNFKQYSSPANSKYRSSIVFEKSDTRQQENKMFDTNRHKDPNLTSEIVKNENGREWQDRCWYKKNKNYKNSRVENTNELSTNRCSNYETDDEDRWLVDEIDDKMAQDKTKSTNKKNDAMSTYSYDFLKETCHLICNDSLISDEFKVRSMHKWLVFSDELKLMTLNEQTSNQISISNKEANAVTNLDQQISKVAEEHRVIHNPEVIPSTHDKAVHKEEPKVIDNPAKVSTEQIQAIHTEVHKEEKVAQSTKHSKLTKQKPLVLLTKRKLIRADSNTSFSQELTRSATALQPLVTPTNLEHRREDGVNRLVFSNGKKLIRQSFLETSASLRIRRTRQLRNIRRTLLLRHLRLQYIHRRRIQYIARKRRLTQQFAWRAEKRRRAEEHRRKYTWISDALKKRKLEERSKQRNKYVWISEATRKDLSSPTVMSLPNQESARILEKQRNDMIRRTMQLSPAKIVQLSMKIHNRSRRAARWRTMKSNDFRRLVLELPVGLRGPLWISRTYFDHRKVVYLRNGFTRRLLLPALSRSYLANILRCRKKIKQNRKICPVYRRSGYCMIENCFYLHDPKFIAICKNFLNFNSCDYEGCKLLHHIIPGKMPTCLKFLRNLCNLSHCQLLHHTPLPEAAICKKFLSGFCELRANCSEWHVYACADFKENSKCSVNNCMLPHRDAKYFQDLWCTDENSFDGRYFSSTIFVEQINSTMDVTNDIEFLDYIPL